MINKILPHDQPARIVSLMWLVCWCLFSTATEADSSTKQSLTKESLDDLCALARCNSLDGTGQDASYALGVKFYRTIGTEFNELDFSVFLKGLKDAADHMVTVDQDALDRSIRSIIISEQDKSIMFLKEFVESTKYDVLEIDGVYVEKSKELSLDLPNNSEFEELCADQADQTELAAATMYRVAYARLELDHTKKTLWNGTRGDGDSQNSNKRKMYGCIDLEEREMIRGWRTVLKEMSPTDIWAVAIPPSLAYGSRGVKDLVGKDVALYFVLQLKSKPLRFLNRSTPQSIQRKLRSTDQSASVLQRIPTSF